MYATASDDSTQFYISRSVTAAKLEYRIDRRDISSSHKCVILISFHRFCKSINVYRTTKSSKPIFNLSNIATKNSQGYSTKEKNRTSRIHRMSSGRRFRDSKGVWWANGMIHAHCPSEKNSVGL